MKKGILKLFSVLIVFIILFSSISLPVSAKTNSNLGKVSGKIWQDTKTILDDEGVLHGNGILDEDEPLISGVKVNLYKEGSNAVYKHTTTDENGKYVIDELPDGNYRVEFVYGNDANDLTYNGQDYKSTQPYQIQYTEPTTVPTPTPTPDPEAKPIYIVFVIDCSDSMKDNLYDMKMALYSTVRELLQKNPNTYIGFVFYGTYPISSSRINSKVTPKVMGGFSNDWVNLRDQIMGINNGYRPQGYPYYVGDLGYCYMDHTMGETNSTAALMAANAMLYEAPENANKYLICFSDGYPTRPGVNYTWIYTAPAEQKRYRLRNDLGIGGDITNENIDKGYDIPLPTYVKYDPDTKKTFSYFRPAFPNAKLTYEHTSRTEANNDKEKLDINFRNESYRVVREDPNGDIILNHTDAYYKIVDGKRVLVDPGTFTEERRYTYDHTDYEEVVRFTLIDKTTEYLYTNEYNGFYYDYMTQCKEYYELIDCNKLAVCYGKSDRAAFRYIYGECGKFETILSATDLSTQFQENVTDYIDEQEGRESTEEAPEPDEYRSSAFDLLNRRLKVMDYSTEIDYEKAKILDRTNNKAEFMNGTHMIATTPVFHVGANQTAWVNLALEERPKQSVMLEKEIESIKITLSNGETFLTWDKDQGIVKNIQVIPDFAISAIMDEELIQGATIEVNYSIKVSNTSEKDNLNNYFTEEFVKAVLQNQDNIFNDYEEWRQLLKESYGINKFFEEMTDEEFETILKTITSTSYRVHDYLGDNIFFDEEKTPTYWKQSDISTVATEYSTEYLLTNKQDVDDPEPYAKPGQGYTLEISASKLLTISEDDLNEFNNYVEVVKYTNALGRRMIDSTGKSIIPANLDYENTSRVYEIDEAKAPLLSIVPPFGGRRLSTFEIILIGAIAITLGVVGIFIYRKHKK